MTAAPPRTAIAMKKDRASSAPLPGGSRIARAPCAALRRRRQIVVTIAIITTVAIRRNMSAKTGGDFMAALDHLGTPVRKRGG